MFHDFAPCVVHVLDKFGKVAISKGLVVQPCNHHIFRSKLLHMKGCEMDILGYKKCILYLRPVFVDQSSSAAKATAFDWP